MPVVARTSPSWRTLSWLVAGVGTLHALALGSTVPNHFGLTSMPSTQVKPLVTRRIAPAALQQEPVISPSQPLAQRVPQAVHQKKTIAVAQAKPASPPTQPSPVDAHDSPPNGADMNASTPSNSSASTQVAPDAGVAAANPSSSTASEPSVAAKPAMPTATTATPTAIQTTPVTAIALPNSTQMRYEVTGSAKGLTYHAKSELIWHHKDSGYEARMTISALFLASRSMTSQGAIGPRGLAPRRFSDQSKTEVATHFEPDKGQISFSANTPSVPWLDGGQDRVSVFIQLGGILAANPAGFPSGANITLYTAGPRDADTWTFQVEGEETLNLPFGQLTTLKLSRQLRDDYDQKLEVWYAPSLGYLPVRNKITKTNGDFVDQQLNAVDGR